MQAPLETIGLWLEGLRRRVRQIPLRSKTRFRSIFQENHRFGILWSEKGSASAEFVLWVIPLFLPLIILIGQVSEVGSFKIETMHLARTALRAFVTAPDTSTGHLRIRQVLGYVGKENSPYLIGCKRMPCIQPNNLVKLTLDGPTPQVRVVVVMETGRWVQGEPGFNPSDVNSKQSRQMGLLENSLSWLENVKDAIDSVGVSK